MKDHCRRREAIIDTFRAGTWAAKSDKLVLAVQASLADTKVQDAIEKEAAALKEVGIPSFPAVVRNSVIFCGAPGTR